MQRRSVIAGLAVSLIAPRQSSAQQASGKIPRIGILSPGEEERTPMWDAFRQGLRDLGYTEGRNIILEFRLAHGDYSLFPKLAAELVGLPVDVIVTEGFTPDAVAATERIPIVAPALMDPVERGFALSLVRPGRNITGFTLMHTELNGKRLELLRTAFPHITRVAALVKRARSWLLRRPRRPPARSVWGTSSRSGSRAPQHCARCVRGRFLERTQWSLFPTACSTATGGTSSR